MSTSRFLRVFKNRKRQAKFYCTFKQKLYGLVIIDYGNNIKCSYAGVAIFHLRGKNQCNIKSHDNVRFQIKNGMPLTCWLLHYRFVVRDE